MTYRTCDIEIASYLEFKTGEIPSLSNPSNRISFSFGQNGDKEKYQILANKYYEDKEKYIKFMNGYKNLRNRLRTFQQ